MSAAYLAAAAGVAAVTWLSVRDGRRIKAARRQLLNAARSALDHPELTYGAGDFPGLKGGFRGQQVVADLIADTLTIRRLPQLWLSVTLLDRNSELPGFAMLVRPAGTEFYSLTSTFDERLEVPSGFPNEILIRGSSSVAQTYLDALAQPLKAILSDPRVKEIAVTPKGLRVIRQAGEGRRGEHLLLRQAMFDGADVPATDLTQILTQLDGLRAALIPLTNKSAA